jgi:protein-tyrosine phosphatase
MNNVRQMVLFVCTGNYYRSRYAEILFNHQVDESSRWRADSRGLQLSAANLGPISQHALERLNARGLVAILEATSRLPQTLAEMDLISAARIIALDENEHPPLVEKYWPAWKSKFEFWNVPDLDRVGPEAALSEIERMVSQLVIELAGAKMQTSIRHRVG